MGTATKRKGLDEIETVGFTRGGPWEFQESGKNKGKSFSINQAKWEPEVYDHSSIAQKGYSVKLS